MKKSFIFLSIITSVAIFYSCSQPGTATSPESGTSLTKDSLVHRGEYLVNVIGCSGFFLRSK